MDKLDNGYIVGQSRTSLDGARSRERVAILIPRRTFWLGLQLYKHDD